MHLPLVSVVMPAHNDGYFIGEAIESFLRQTYGHFELIVVDDGSTDHTVDVVSRYRDDRIVLIQRKIWSCGSIHTACNDGLAVARGEVIACADARDVSLPDRLEHQVAFFQENFDVDVLGGGVIPIFGTRPRRKMPVLKPVYRARPERYRLELLEGRSVVLHQTAMFRRHILEKLSGYRDYLACSDYDFLLRAARYFRLCNLDRVLIYGRPHREHLPESYAGAVKKALHQILLTREQLWGERELEKSRLPGHTGPLLWRPAGPGRARPRISIVMPAYNNGPFIGEAIDSLLTQTYGNFELIVVDDASTDNTFDIVQTYRDDRILYLRREESTCSGNFARNDGLAVCRGDLIALADADDIYVPDRLEQQVRFLDQHSDVDILGGSMAKIDAQGQDLKEILTRPVYDQPHLYRRVLLQGKMAIFIPTMMFRRQVLDRVPGFNDYPAAADYEFLLRASRYYKLHNLKQVLVYYRQHEGSVTHRTGHRLRNTLHRTFLAREYLWGQKYGEEMHDRFSKSL